MDNDFTPMKLTKMMQSDKRVLECEVGISTNEKEVQVYIRLYFWSRLRAILFSDYAHKLLFDWSLELLDKLPENTALRIKLVL